MSYDLNTFFACPYCGALNQDPRPWGGQDRVCPDCQDKEHPGDVVVAEAAGDATAKTAGQTP